MIIKQKNCCKMVIITNSTLKTNKRLFLTYHIVATQYISFDLARDAAGFILRTFLKVCCICFRNSSEPSP